MNLKNKKKACPERSRRVFVGMSGGVDSSVAAALLKKQGYDVFGVFIKSYNVDGTMERDMRDAKRAAKVLKIPFHVFDFEKECKDMVVTCMVEEYRRGLTPNPDVMCNKKIKFGLFLERALKMGADYVATGHYARLASRYVSTGTGVRRLLRSAPPTPHPEIFASQKPSISGLRSYRTKHTGKLATFHLLEARDKNKDQSYFLWTLTQKQLKHCLFPIGDYVKPDVRKMARRFKLPVAGKKDSQGICMLGMVNLKKFLSQYIKPKRGIVINTKGEIVGEHDGTWFYTIGQRHLKVNQRPMTSNQRPFYVAEKDIKTNTILVAEGNDPILYKKEIKLKKVNFINPVTYKSKFIPLEAEARCEPLRPLTRFIIPVMARVRYRQPLFKAKLYKLKTNSYKLIFDEPQKFIAPGQSAVFYLPARIRQPAEKEGVNLEMLGGGIII